MNRIIFILAFVALSGIAPLAQQVTPTEEEVRAELDRRGLEEEEVSAALSARGIDINNLEDLTPEQIVELQQVIEALEAEKEQDASASDTSVTQPTTTRPAQIDTVPVPPVVSVDTEIDDETGADPLPRARIYGHHLFREGQIRVFTQSDDLRAPEAYTLGSGDQITVSVWGLNRQFEERYEVNPEGYVFVRDGRVRVLVKGLTLRQARSKLRSVFSGFMSFRNSDFDVALNFARTIQISVFGAVFRPGTLNLPATNNALSALAAAGGPTDNGSVRRIQLIRNDGGNQVVDVYKFMFEPTSVDNLFLENNDAIHVPTHTKTVTIEGAVKRPYTYELLPSEGLSDLLTFSGGLTQDAYRRTFRVTRFADDEQLLLTIPYAELLTSNGDYDLRDGDVVTVERIATPVSNFVSVDGTVSNPGDFELRTGMRLSDVIAQAGLRPESHTELAYLRRRNTDGTISFVKLNLDDVLNDPTGPGNLLMENYDQLTIWPKSRFVDAAQVAVGGAVRFPDRFSYDIGQQVHVDDAVNLAGGLRRDASEVAFIYRRDPLKPKQIEYIRLNVQDAINTANSAQNILLQPFDSLVVMSTNIFIEESTIGIAGAVNLPGTFQYGKEMQLRDLLTLAGGFRLGAAMNKVEVSRTVIRDNEPTKTIIANLSVDRDYNIIDADVSDFRLEPFDQVYVRFVPEFSLQKSVMIRGEVLYPGEHALISHNEKISSIIGRAGGLTDEAFAEGATLYREEDSLGYIVMRLDEALGDNRSRYNYILKDGDLIVVPTKKDFVTIRGATKVREVVQDDVVGDRNEIKVAFHEGKNAKFYIEFYAGGLAENADRNKIFVEYPNGEIRRAKKRLFGRNYPEVTKGAVISVGTKEEEVVDPSSEQEDVDWTKVLGDSVAQAMSILTLILLIQRLD